MVCHNIDGRYLLVDTEVRGRSCDQPVGMTVLPADPGIGGYRYLTRRARVRVENPPAGAGTGMKIHQ
jgi:hypothetical protein